MRLTRRGYYVLGIAALTTAFIVGLTTANWCWYGYCGP